MIDSLLFGAINREQASLWAGALHMYEAADPVVEEALDILTLIDARHFEDGRPRNYLYDFEELISIRRELNVAVDDQ